MGISKISSGTFENSENSWSIKRLVTRLKKKKNSDLDGFMVIGIDFGTTYSGAAWATIADFESDQVNLITTWPGHGREEGKAPTEIFYEHENFMWGYTIPRDADPIRWFKLLLLREDDLASELKGSEILLRGRKMLRESGKTATDLIGDYLKALWKHILKTIYKARGKSVIEAMVFHVVITVPAIWKDYARQGMEEAATKAGILTARPAGPTTLAFAPEPEAAALATLCEGGRNFDAEDVFVVCDAGGGTVDLISYKVCDVDPLALQEAVIGTGGLCGGIFIDEAFESMCKNRLGRKWNKLSQTGIRDIMKSEWECAIKPQFRLDNANEEYVVAIPAEALKGSDLNDESRKPYIKSGRIHFSSTDIKQAFAESFSEIGNLVDEQIRKIEGGKLSVTGVILVGGLGSSPYLYEYLKNHYGGKKIDILQSTGIKPRTAICRGAILKGFLEAPTVLGNSSERVRDIACSVSVISTIARASLGITCDQPFQEGKHLEMEKYWNEHAGMYYARKQMWWYLRKGDNVSKLAPQRKGWRLTYISEEDFKKVIHLSIYQCEDDDPPTRYTESVKKLCHFKCTLDVPYSSLTDFIDANGKNIKKLLYDVEMIPSGASNEFRVLYKGKQLGSQNGIDIFLRPRIRKFTKGHGRMTETSR